MNAIDYDRFTTLGEVARHHAKERPQAVALSFEGRETTYAEFDRNTDRLAAALAAAGVEPGERISYLGKNSDLYFELVFGAAKAGVVMAPVGWRLAPGEIAYVVNDTGAKVLFFGPEMAPCVAQIRGELADVAEAVAMGPGAGDWPVYATWRDAARAHAPVRAPAEDEVAVQLYTSGTTGRPKGAMLTHRNILGARREAARAPMGWNEWRADDVSLVAMPAAHIGGTGWGVWGLYAGVKNVVLAEFNAPAVLDAVVRNGVTKLFLVPAAMQILARQPGVREMDFSKLRHILYGASPIPLDLLRECMEVFGCAFCQQYGMTETCGTIVYLPPEDHDPAGNERMRAAGIAMPGVELRIVDSNGAALPAGAIGEVATRSVANMAGYWRLPEATAQTIDAEGWLRTGDAGYLDEDGYLFIQDRVKDVIISGGENIYPAEVESAIYGHPDVAEVAVIGVPDETWGEAVTAIVVATPGADPKADDIIAFARSRIAHFKAPKSVAFAQALPRSASGKVLRRELREPYWAGRERRVN